MASHHRDPDQGTRQQGDEDRRSDVATEEEAHHRSKLDVAQTHSPRVGECRREQQTAGAGGGDRPLRQAAGIADGGDRDRGNRRDQEDPVGDDPPLEVGEGDGDERGYEDEAEGDFPRIAPEHDDGRRVEQAQRHLGQRIAGRDRRAAAPGPASQGQPGEDRDVVVSGDLGTTPRAARTRPDDRFSAGNAVGDDGYEAARDQPPEEGEHRGAGHH